MLLWEIRGQKGQGRRCGWIVAWSHVEAHDIARYEKAELIGEPVEWFPGNGSQVFWQVAHSENGSDLELDAPRTGPQH